MLVYDREWNQFSNTPANYGIWLHSLLDSPSFSENYVHQSRNSDYLARFKVVKDWTFTLAPATEPGSERDVRFYSKLTKMYTKFVNSGSDQYSVSQGQLSLIYFTDRATTSDNPTMNYMAKIKFTDN